MKSASLICANIIKLAKTASLFVVYSLYTLVYNAKTRGGQLAELRMQVFPLSDFEAFALESVLVALLSPASSLLQLER